jgi:Mg-chelatase subunit ChlI
MIYDLAYIYVIYDIEDHTLTYYGSTCDLKHRMSTHKCLKTNVCTSKQIIERGKYEVAILETHENIDKYDLHERERWYIENKPCVNKFIPHRTKKEYYQDNKEKFTEQQKEYRQDNKEKIAERNKEYRQDNKEKIAEQKKEYRQNNKEKIAEYYQNNKEKMNEKFVCECGGKYTHNHTARHKKTQKHLKWVQSCKI